MPVCVMATKVHHGGVSPDCPFKDVIRDTVMASKELGMAATAAYGVNELYTHVHSVASTLGTHSWLNGHYMFMAIFEELFRAELASF